jgi:hypothetical protein
LRVGFVTIAGPGTIPSSLGQSRVEQKVKLIRSEL